MAPNKDKDKKLVIPKERLGLVMLKTYKYFWLIKKFLFQKK
jgi:hypothetical protein